MRLNDDIERSRYFAGRRQYGQAAFILQAALEPDDTVDPQIRAWFYALRGAFRLPLCADLGLVIDDLRQSLQLTGQNGDQNEAFCHLTEYNLALALLLQNRPDNRGPNETQGRLLNEAMELLLQVSRALVSHPDSEALRRRAAVALALVSEIQYTLSRTDDAVRTARQACQQLDEHRQDLMAARRLLGCYGILQLAEPSWEHPSGRYALANSPGVFSAEEFDDYHFIN